MKGLIVVVLFFCHLNVVAGQESGCVLKLPVQLRFDENRFLGVWYEIEVWPGLHENATTLLDNVSYNISRRAGENDKIYSKIRASDKGSTVCKDEPLLTRRKSRDAVYTFSYKRHAGLTQVVWTDYDKMAVEFICYETDRTTCVNPGVVFWSRTTSLTSAQTRRGESFLSRLCVDPTRRFKIEHTKDCAYEHVVAPRSPCHLLKTVQPNFDENKFLGVWYETDWWPGPHQNESNVLDNLAFTISRKDGKDGILLSEGHASDRGSTTCFTLFTLTRTRSRPAVYTFDYGGKPGSSQVIWTDYDKMAVEFVCYEMDRTNTDCVSPGAVFWSRTTSLTSAQTEHGESFLDSLCVDPTRRFKIKHTNDCAHPSSVGSHMEHWACALTIGFLVVSSILFG